MQFTILNNELYVWQAVLWLNHREWDSKTTPRDPYYNRPIFVWTQNMFKSTDFRFEWYGKVLFKNADDAILFFVTWNEP